MSKPEQETPQTSTEPKRIGEMSELVAGEPVLVYLGRDERGRPRQAIVVLDPDAGTARAWLNLCKHLPIPLDAGSGHVMADDTRHLVCLTHGAEYRVSDGYCVSGPCEGTRLTPIRIELDDEGVLWALD